MLTNVFLKNEVSIQIHHKQICQFRDKAPMVVKDLLPKIGGKVNELFYEWAYNFE